MASVRPCSSAFDSAPARASVCASEPPGPHPCAPPLSPAPSCLSSHTCGLCSASRVLRLHALEGPLQPHRPRSCMPVLYSCRSLFAPPPPPHGAWYRCSTYFWRGQGEGLLQKRKGFQLRVHLETTGLRQQAACIRTADNRRRRGGNPPEPRFHGGKNEIYKRKGNMDFGHFCNTNFGVPDPPTPPLF